MADNEDNTELLEDLHDEMRWQFAEMREEFANLNRRLDLLTRMLSGISNRQVVHRTERIGHQGCRADR